MRRWRWLSVMTILELNCNIGVYEDFGSYVVMILFFY